MSAKRDLDRDSLFKSILGDLGGDAEPEATSQIAVSAIRFNRDQPRRHFDEVALAELSGSIAKRGVLEPILVRRQGNEFELIAGERRTRAAIAAGLEQIPAVVLDVDDDAALEISIMENLQREDLNAVEETEAVLRLLQLHLDASRDQVVGILQEIYNEERGRGGAGKHGEPVKRELKELLARLGRFTASSFYVNRVPILEFPDELLNAVRTGALEFTKAQVLARVKDDKLRNQLLIDAVANGLTLSQIRARVAGPNRQKPASDPLVDRTRKKLTGRRMASLSSKDRSRVMKLLEELYELLDD